MKINNGVYSVLMTPFKENMKIDYDSYYKLLDRMEDSHITGLVVLGTTSESPTLSLEEKVNLVSAVWHRFKGHKRVMVGIGGNNTAATLEFALEVKDKCDSMLITVPNYNKPSQRGIQAHFETVCQHEQLKHKPFMLYNVPSRCGVSVDPQTVANVYKSCENVCAIKEASGSLEQALGIKNLCDIQIFSGDDSLTVPIMSIGGSGVISVIANILPNEINRVYNSCRGNDYSDAMKEYLKLHPLIKALFLESNPVPGKEILHKLNVFSTNLPRLPLVPMSDENKRTVMRIFTNTQSSL